MQHLQTRLPHCLQPNGAMALCFCAAKLYDGNIRIDPKEFTTEEIEEKSFYGS